MIDKDRPRKALVIGNTMYGEQVQHVYGLEDARRVRMVLTEMHFRCFRYPNDHRRANEWPNNCDDVDLKDAIELFLTGIEDGDVVRPWCNPVQNLC
jgi:hypothetical protein